MQRYLQSTFVLTGSLMNPDQIGYVYSSVNKGNEYSYCQFPNSFTFPITETDSPNSVQVLKLKVTLQDIFMYTKAQFRKDCENAEKSINSLKKLQQERKQLASIKQSTGRVEYKIRGEMQALAVEIDHLFRSLQLSTNLAIEETEKRQEIIKAYENQYFDIKKEEESLKIQKQPTQKKDPEVLTNQQLQLYQKSLYSQQEETLEGIQGTVENLGNIGKNINQELLIHNKLMDHVDTNVDKTTTKLDNLNFKIQKLLRKMSNSCCLCFILILSITLVLILIFL